MVNKLVLGMVMISLLVSGVIGYFTYIQKGEVVNLSGRLKAAREEIAVLSSTGSNLDTRLNTISDDLASLKEESASEYASLEAGIKKSMEDITADGNRITEVDNNLSALTGQVSAIKPGLAADSVYATAIKAVVQVSDGKETIGGGFIYDNKNHIVTANHVIEDIDEIYVVFYDGSTSKATIINQSPFNDVAVLLLEQPTNLSPAVMGDSKSVKIGDDVLVVGHPFRETNSLTVGVISQVNRMENIGDEQPDAQWICNLFQFDAPVNPGNSGGPLFNAKGEVIGMVVAGIKPYMGEGMGLAVSSNKVKRAASVLIEDRRQGGYLIAGPVIGVHAKEVGPSEARAIGRESVGGVLVTKVSYPAAEADVRVGDVIISVKNMSVNNIGDFASIIDEYVREHDLVVLGVIRDGKKLDIPVKATERADGQPWIRSSLTEYVFFF
jgi:S1-C subfamily serine protease